MQITKTSLVSGITRTLDLGITEDQLTRWNSGELIQDVFPHLSEDEREFLKTGITPEEWNHIFEG
jgi:hypothetical protein